MCRSENNLQGLVCFSHVGLRSGRKCLFLLRCLATLICVFDYTSLWLYYMFWFLILKRFYVYLWAHKCAGGFRGPKWAAGVGGLDNLKLELTLILELPCRE